MNSTLTACSTSLSNVAHKQLPSTREAVTKRAIQLLKLHLFKKVILTQEETFDFNTTVVTLSTKAIDSEQNMMESNILSYGDDLDSALLLYGVLKYQSKLTREGTELDLSKFLTCGLNVASTHKLMEACLLYKRNFKLFELYEETLAGMSDEDIKAHPELFALIARATNLTRQHSRAV